MYTTLISVEQLHDLQQQGAPLRVFDCSFDLMQPTAGRTQFATQHIPGARHADLDLHLSAHDRTQAVNGGRHPLPTRESFAQWLSSTGLTHDTQELLRPLVVDAQMVRP